MRSACARITLLLALAFLAAAPVAAQQPKEKQPAKPTKKISDAERDELFASVDQILKWVSRDTGLPIKFEIKRELSTRDQVQKYVEERMKEDDDQKRLERSELVLKKFGLLPRDFKLRSFMIALLRDQVAGFYDSKRKTVHLLDWIEADSQRPVLAHELTHALQDQTVDLDQWVKEARERAKKSSDPETAETELDEMISARSALLEGQGMAVLIDYILEPRGSNLLSEPLLAEQLKVSMTSTQGSAVLESAPLLLRESLVFPYRDGLGFIQALLLNGGAKKAYAQALQSPPRNTRDILSPESYLKNQAIPTMRIPVLEKELGKGFVKYDVGSVGQFDIVLFAKQFSSNVDARELSSAWRGGYYYSALKKDAEKRSDLSTADLGVIYLSRWSSPAMAQRFADLYTRSFRIKYKSVTKEEDRWDSEEGPLCAEVHGDQLLIMEGFDAATAAKIRASVLRNEPVPGENPKVAVGNLSLKTVAPIFAMRLLLH